jgi:hypothetical protein
VPEHLRALVVILVIATFVWSVAQVPFTHYVCAREDFKRRRNMWFVLTLTAFFAHNFWIFCLVTGLALTWTLKDESNRYAMFLGLMLTLPYFGRSIGGLGVVNELFTLTQLRLLALVILVPTWLHLRRQPGVEPFGSLLADKLLMAMIAWEVILTLPDRTVTSVVRDSVLYKFTDVFLTYYVASRALRSSQAFRDALGAFVAGAMVFCLVLVFESVRNWLLYRAVDDALGAALGTGGIYLRRAGLLRAEGTAGQSIVAGLTASIAMGLFLYIGGLIRSLPWRAACFGILTLGLIAALARAPWIGTVFMFLVFFALGPSPMSNLLKMGGVFVGAAILLVLTGADDRVIDFLPWVGTVDANTVEGRERLATVALQVIRENLLFGRYDYGTLPALEVLRDGSGIIDIVNTYIIIALRGGITSLGLFIAFIAAALFALAAALHGLPDRRDERHAMGRAVLATLLGVLFIIATVSPIFNVYPLYYTLAGLAVGFGRLVARGERPVAGAAAGPARPASRGPAPRWAGRPGHRGA